VVTLAVMGGASTALTCRLVSANSSASALASGQARAEGKSAAPPPSAEPAPAKAAEPGAPSGTGKQVQGVLGAGRKAIEGMDDNDFRKIRLFLQLAELQITFGDRPAALESCEKAVATVRAWTDWDGSTRDGELRMIAPVQALAGDVKGA